MQLNSRAVFGGMLLAVTVASLPHGANSAEIKVIAANALKDGYTELVAAFEKSSGHKVVTTWAGTENATKRVSDGEAYDLVIIGSKNIDQLIAAGKLATGSRADFAQNRGWYCGSSRFAEARRFDHRRRKSCRAGGQVDCVLCRTERRLCRGNAQEDGCCRTGRIQGQTAIVGCGGGRNPCAWRGRSWFRPVKRILEPSRLVDLGPLPASIQNFTIYAVGLHVAAPSPDAAKALVKHLKAPEATSAIKKMSMEPG